VGVVSVEGGRQSGWVCLKNGCWRVGVMGFELWRGVGGQGRGVKVGLRVN